jgi:hypothetical protein
MDSATKAAKGAFTIVVKKSILGAKVVNAQREDLGTIEDIVLDARNNRLAYAILSFGGFLGLGDRHFAIPWEASSFDLSQKVAVLDINKDRLSNAPGFEKENWPDMANPNRGSQIYRHYGCEPYWESATTQSEQPPGR